MAWKWFWILQQGWILFKFSIGVGIGERMSGKEFGRQGLIFDEKMTILAVDHHGDHKVGPIVFILGKNIAKYKEYC